MKNDASSVLFRRLPYMLSPQLDIYERLPQLVRGSNRVLEVGFGTGIGVLQYAHSVNHVVAIEVDPAAVHFAQRCFRLGNIQWHEADIADDPVQMIGDPYDFIVMIEVLEHIEFANLALVNVRALLKPGNQALITVPNSRRSRRKEEILNIQEWDPEGFRSHLSKHFGHVELLNFNFLPVSNFKAGTETPLIALCS